jgi:hypothetical protein
VSGSADTGIAFALRDGSRVVVRPVRPDDRELLLVSYLTDVDHTTTTRPPLWTRRRGGVGVARFVRCSERLTRPRPPSR